MPRQPNHGRDAQHEPTWANIGETIQWLEATYGGHVQVVVDTEGTRNASGALWVRAMLYRGFQVHGERPVDVVAALWPTNKHRTMTGLMYRLLHQLDHAADARMRAEQEELPF